MRAVARNWATSSRARRSCWLRCDFSNRWLGSTIAGRLLRTLCHCPLQSPEGRSAQLFTLPPPHPHTVCRYLANRVEKFQTAAFYLAIMVNFLILTCYQAATFEGGLREAKCDNKFLDRESPIDINALITFMGFFQTACAVLVVVFFYLNKGPLIIRRGFEARHRRSTADNDDTDADVGVDEPDVGVVEDKGGAAEDHESEAGAGADGNPIITATVPDGALRASIVGNAAAESQRAQMSRVRRLLFSSWFLLKDPFFLWCTLQGCVAARSQEHGACSRCVKCCLL